MNEFKMSSTRYLYPSVALLISPSNKEPWNKWLGTSTKSFAPTGFEESSKPTKNIEKESAAPATGPAIDMSNIVFLSGRMDLNYRSNNKNKKISTKMVCIRYQSSVQCTLKLE